jgi:PPOX class probable F420-dependent enzyme
VDKSVMRRNADQARVARVATVDGRGQVHLVPVTFALSGDVWYPPTDAGERLAKRLRNLTGDPRVSILIDVYDEDWSKVWWVRLHGSGRVVPDSPERDHAWRLLRAKYPQFTDTPSDEGAGPVMAVDINHWVGWSYSG